MVIVVIHIIKAEVVIIPGIDVVKYMLLHRQNSPEELIN
jgi:hypothetical protein